MIEGRNLEISHVLLWPNKVGDWVQQGRSLHFRQHQDEDFPRCTIRHCSLCSLMLTLLAGGSLFFLFGYEFVEDWGYTIRCHHG